MLIRRFITSVCTVTSRGISSVTSYVADVRIPDETLHATAFRSFPKYGEKTALVDAVSGRSYTYSDLLRMCKSFASGIVKLGAKKGDVLVMYSGNSIDYPVVALGAMAAGVIISTVNPANTPRELSEQLIDSGARFLYTTEQLHALAAPALPDTAVDHVIVDGDVQNCVSYSSLAEDDGTSFPHEMTFDPASDVACLLYSSGTTGKPKGVMLTHTNLLANHYMTHDIPDLQIPSMVRHLEANPEHQPVAFGLLPFFHIYGLHYISFISLIRGHQVVSIARFEPQLFMSSIQDFKVSILYLVPPLLVFLLKSDLLSSYDVSSVKAIVLGAAPLASEIVELTHRTFPEVSMHQMYGMTETSPLLTYPYYKPGFHPPAGSVGTPITNTEMRMVDIVSGQALGPHQEGEIWARGPQVMKGYWKNPEATRNTIDDDGWIHTGDIGYYDDNRNVFITGRLKELIKYKAFQVAPAELEGVLLIHPQIADAAVVGIPDEATGELPKAFIVPKPATTLCEEEVHRHCKDLLADYKQLRGGIQFVAQIPKTPSGKILRRQLLQLHDNPSSSDVIRTKQ